MILQSGCLVLALFPLLGVASTSSSSILGPQEDSADDQCATDCYKLFKPTLLYVTDLHDNIKALKQNCSSLITDTNNGQNKQIDNARQKEISDFQNRENGFKTEINKLRSQLTQCKAKLMTLGCKSFSTGIHKIEIPGLHPFSALCNGDIKGGGWITILKRFNGSLDFNRNWTEYRNGFGNLTGEFFIGLEQLHRITDFQLYTESYILYIEMKYFDGGIKFASYDDFRIGNEDEQYKLESLGTFWGTANNSMEYLLGSKFSTFDQDNDRSGFLNCAKMHGPWWHNDCGYVYLNGIYSKSDLRTYESMSWSDTISLKSVQMLIRPRNTD